MKKGLQALYEADKQERLNQPQGNTPEYKAVRARDPQRRVRLMESASTNVLQTAEDYYRAAHIMNHGDTIEDAKNAHFLHSVPVS